jgi:hypothetical protein
MAAASDDNDGGGGDAEKKKLEINIHIYRKLFNFCIKASMPVILRQRLLVAKLAQKFYVTESVITVPTKALYLGPLQSHKNGVHILTNRNALKSILIPHVRSHPVSPFEVSDENFCTQFSVPCSMYYMLPHLVLLDLVLNA